MHNPIIVKSHGDHERIMGCFGNCGEPYKVDFEDENQPIRFFVCEENKFSVCTSCGLWFYVASNDTIAQMRVDELLENDEDVQREFVTALYSEAVSNGEVTQDEADKQLESTMATLGDFREARRTLAAKRAVEDSLFDQRFLELVGDRSLENISPEEQYELAEKVKDIEFENLKGYVDAVEALREKIPSQIANL